MSREWEKAYHWFSREAVPAFSLSPTQIAVYNALRDRADDNGETFPSQDTIGRESGIGPRAVRAAVARLVEAGLVEIVGGGRRVGIRYRIGMCPSLPETGSRIRNDRAEMGSRIRNEFADTGSRIRSKPDRGSDEERPREEDPSTGAPPQADDGEVFDQFWDIYPVARRGSRADLLAAWKATRGYHPADILDRCRIYLRSLNGKEQFVVGACKWLREHRWDQVKVPALSADQRAREIWERHGRPEEGTPGWESFVAERDDERRAS